MPVQNANDTALLPDRLAGGGGAPARGGRLLAAVPPPHTVSSPAPVLASAQLAPKPEVPGPVLEAVPPPGMPAGPSPGQLHQSALEAWFATPQGAYILEWEMARLDQVVADIFGYYAVQIGLPGIDFLRANRMTSRLTASLGTGAQVVADAHELPFQSESLDLVVLPHLLEFSDEPHQILREVERVLRPEGQVIVLCFNPVSLWGVKKLFSRNRSMPWSGEFVSVLRMKDWLKLLNFEMRGGRFGRYRPPFISEKWLERLGFLEPAGDRWWPVAGAVYLMQAKKRVAGMRIITPSWRKERRKLESLAVAPDGVNGHHGSHGNVNTTGVSGQPPSLISNNRKKQHE
jgi:SAM-dependent methyltransferase